MFFDSVSLTAVYSCTWLMPPCLCLFFRRPIIDVTGRLSGKWKKTAWSDDKWISKLPLCPFAGLNTAFLVPYF